MDGGKVILGEGDRGALVEVLLSAQGEGLVGPGPVGAHLDHALGFAEIVGEPSAALDLGSGAGVPGLALALVWPTTNWVLLDGRRRSAAFLEVAVARLGIAERVQIVEARAEEAARGGLRGTFDLVVARGMGPPAATAECAAGFLRVGGRLAVSEPPEEKGRWTPSGLRTLGLSEARRIESSSGAHFAVLSQESPCPDRFPRRTGQPAKRPLF